MVETAGADGDARTSCRGRPSAELANSDVSGPAFVPPQPTVGVILADGSPFLPPKMSAEGGLDRDEPWNSIPGGPPNKIVLIASFASDVLSVVVEASSLPLSEHCGGGERSSMPMSGGEACVSWEGTFRKPQLAV